MGCSLEKSAAEELVIDYVAQTLDPAASLEFERHLAWCERCRALVAQQRAVWSMLEEWQPQPVPATFNERVARDLVGEVRAAWWQRLHWNWRPALTVAAACVVVLGAFLLKEDDHSSASASEDRSSARIEQRVEHALDDMDLLTTIGVDVSAGQTDSPHKI